MNHKPILLCLCYISSFAYVQNSSAEVDPKWTTTGFKQVNTMGAGEAPISKKGKFRVFVLMGQSNMQGAGRAINLKAPYTETHERIRIWANGGGDAMQG